MNTQLNAQDFVDHLNFAMDWLTTTYGDATIAEVLRRFNILLLNDHDIVLLNHNPNNPNILYHRIAMIQYHKGKFTNRNAHIRDVIEHFNKLLRLQQLDSVPQTNSACYAAIFAVASQCLLKCVKQTRKKYVFEMLGGGRIVCHHENRDDAYFALS